MSARVIDGKGIAARFKAETRLQVLAFIAKTGVVPNLTAILVGDDPASAVYVQNKEKSCAQAGLKGDVHRLPDNTTQTELLSLIARLNADSSVHGILVQLPLPKQIDETRVLESVSPLKDVDGFHPENAGLLMQGRPRFVPCTPRGCQVLLAECEQQLPGFRVAGSHAVIVGRSEIVGKPMAMLLMQKSGGKSGENLGTGDRGQGTGGHADPMIHTPDAGPRSPVPDSLPADATVTVCHSRTRNLSEITRQADILIAAIGRPKFITAEMVKPGAVVIDVGINRVEGKLCGDVEYEPVSRVAAAITPVPGGVGPMTIALLLHNTLTAAKLAT